jgi:hypothetical protein
MSGNYPVPRVPPGRHRNWCNCRGCLNRIAAEEADLTKFSLALWAGAAAVAGLITVALIPLRIWHVTGTDGKQHPDAATWIAYGIGGAVIMACLMFFSIRSATRAERQAARMTRIREAREAADEVLKAAPPPVPAPVPPACRHLHAVPVDLSTGETVAYWCEQCETQLDESFGRFRRFCCGTEPGDPPHWPSCPEAKVTP